MNRRRLTLLMVVVLGGLTVAVTAAWAGFPNILRYKDPVLVYGPQAPSALRTTAAVATAANPLADPRVFVDEIVIDDVDAPVTVTLTASFRAEYVCVRGHTVTTGTTLVGHVSGSAVFRPQHGHIATGSLLTQRLPSPARAAELTGFHCSSGKLKFDQAVFYDLVLDAHGGERLELHDTLVSHPVYG